MPEPAGGLLPAACRGGGADPLQRDTRPESLRGARPCEGPGPGRSRPIAAGRLQARSGRGVRRGGGGPAAPRAVGGGGDAEAVAGPAEAVHRGLDHHRLRSAPRAPRNERPAHGTRPPLVEGESLRQCSAGTHTTRSHSASLTRSHSASLTRSHSASPTRSAHPRRACTPSHAPTKHPAPAAALFRNADPAPGPRPARRRHRARTPSRFSSARPARSITWHKRGPYGAGVTRRVKRPASSRTHESHRPTT